MNKLFNLVGEASVLALVALLLGCGGGDETPITEADNSPKTDNSPKGEETTEEPTEEPELVPEPEPEPPDPNGFYATTGEETNGKPVYKDTDGFFLWFDGSRWVLSDKLGGGKIVAKGTKELNDKWSAGAHVSTFPDKDFAKEATFRLAVAYQGSDDFADAILLFNRFITEYPEDKMVADAHLSLGDLVMTQVPSEQQPTQVHIDESRGHYAKVRELSDAIRLVTDATFNEGGLLERIAGNPEGPVQGVLDEVDKDKDDALSKAEFAKSRLAGFKNFATFNINGDKVIDYGELVDAVTIWLYADMETLFREYKKKYAEEEGARLSQASHKIGLACEKQGRPEDMLREYYGAIEKYGGDSRSIGTDEILRIYVERHTSYSTRYKLTLELLELLANPNERVSFTYDDRREGLVKVSLQIKEILNDRRNLIRMCRKKYVDPETNEIIIDADVYNRVLAQRGALLVDEKQKAWVVGMITKYKTLVANFPSDLAPKVKFREMLAKAKSQGQKALELRMRVILDYAGAPVNDGYVPSKSDYSDASPSVLSWMGRKSLDTGDSDGAVAAMERLLSTYPDAAEYVFEANLVLGDVRMKEKEFPQAEEHYFQAYQNFSWHERVGEAQLKLGDARREVGRQGDKSKYKDAVEVYSSVRNSEEMTMEQRAEASFKMGECLFAVNEYGKAAYYYRDTCNNFPGAVVWADKAFDQAIKCYGQVGDSDLLKETEDLRIAWERKYKDN